MISKKIIAAFVFSIVSFSAFSQVVYTKPHFGVKIGANTSYSVLTPNYTYLPKFQSHLHAGVFYRIRKNRWIFQPEAEYTVKGGTFKGATDLTANEVIRNNFNYFILQPTVGYVVTEGLTFEAGPQFGFKINSVNGPAKSNETSFSVGFRYDVLDALEDVSFAIRYNHGLSNVSASSNQTVTNNTFQLSVIYNWYKKK